jgi:penicillin-binding protein 1A
LTPRRLLAFLLFGLVALAAAFAPAAWFRRAALEHQIRARILEEASRRGLVAQVGGVDVGFRPPLIVSGLRVARSGRWSVEAETAALAPRPLGEGVLSGARLALGRLRVVGPGGLTAEAGPTVWDVERDRSGATAFALRQPFSGLLIKRRPATGGIRLEARAIGAPLGSLLTVRRNGVPLLDAGVVDGRARLSEAGGSTIVDVDVDARGARMVTLDGATGESDAALAAPADLRLQLEGSWLGAEGRLEVPRWQLATEGLSLSGSLSLVDVPRDPRLTLAFEADRVDLARLLTLSAPEAPSAVAASVSEGGSEPSLGSASLSARVTGSLSDASSFAVEQKLDFTPPRRMPPAIARLRGGFVHEAALSDGERKLIDVSPGSPDFVPLRDVPELLVRTVLLGEDAGFFGHHGIDLAELPSAILTDWSRGTAARGASTITQQLAKNLFLSREKRLGRKLQEVALALLLESALGKERILEIYLNVIEWGPGLYGLRPAARQYFGKEPSELTPGQMALLVALIPGPLKYQRSLASGTPSPGFRPLVDRLLAKLRSVDAISEEEYQTALAEDLHVVPAGAGE